MMRHADDGLSAQAQFLLRQDFSAVNNALGFGNGGQVAQNFIREFISGIEHIVIYQLILELYH
jgi:hypothetical protein